MKDLTVKQLAAISGVTVRTWHHWHRPCPPRSYSGLADLYLAHPDFVARYETLEKGFAEYLTRAMKVHAQKGSGAAG